MRPRQSCVVFVVSTSTIPTVPTAHLLVRLLACSLCVSAHGSCSPYICPLTGPPPAFKTLRSYISSWSQEHLQQQVSQGPGPGLLGGLGLGQRSGPGWFRFAAEARAGARARAKIGRDRLRWEATGRGYNGCGGQRWG